MILLIAILLGIIKLFGLIYVPGWIVLLFFITGILVEEVA